MNHRKVPAGRISEEKLVLINDVMWSVPRIYHRMASVFEQIYSAHHLTAGKRSLLHDLSKRGPHTIAEMVRIRPPVTRQYIQRLISELTQAGMVTLKENPDDRRTKVVHLAKEGRRVMKVLEPVEQRMGQILAADLSGAELRTTCATLKKIAALLEDEALWPIDR